MSYIRKTKDIYEIQAYYFTEWEVTNTELTYKAAKQSIKEYRENAPEYAYKIVKKREYINVPDKNL